ncbi:hypothetical protein D3C73_862910 [compost metagenome]
MLGTVVMHLQAQRTARLDRDSLDLETLAVVDRVVGSPRAVDLAVPGRFTATVCLQLRHHRLDLLHAVGLADQHRIVGLDHDDIVEPDHRHQALAVGIRVAAVDGDHIALVRIAIAVLLRHITQCGPRADIVPAGVQRNHHGVCGFFHHGIVDGIGGNGGECLFVETGEIRIAAGLLPGLAAAGQHVGLEALQFLQVARGLEQEHPAVPVILAAADVTGGGLKVGLFDKALDRTQALPIGGLDIAVAGFRTGRHDAEGHQLAGLGSAGCSLHDCAERGLIGDHMVRGQHQQQRIGAVAGGLQGCDRDRWRRIAANRFQDDGSRLGADLLQLLGSDEAVLLVGDHQRAMRGDGSHALPGGLQHGQFTGQGQELLGIGLA